MNGCIFRYIVYIIIAGVLINAGFINNSIMIQFTNVDKYVIAISLPEDWPSRGEVKFSGVTLKYGNSKEPVIQNFYLHVPAGQLVNDS